MYFDASGYKYRAWEDGGYNSYYIDEEYYLFDNQGIMQTIKSLVIVIMVRMEKLLETNGFNPLEDIDIIMIIVVTIAEGLVQMVQNMQILKKSMVNTMPLIRMVI